MELQNFNNDFLLIRTAPGAALGRYLLAHPPDFVGEVLVTETEICLPLRRNFTGADEAVLRRLLAEAPRYDPPGRSNSVPFVFSDHPDWEAVERHTQLSRTDIEQQLTALTFRVAQFGFLPGFVYLTGLPDQLHVPRKATPAKYVAAGSVAIGGKYVGIYPTDSPGGWHVVGRVVEPIFQPDRLPPVEWQLGDAIRLCPV